MKFFLIIKTMIEMLPLIVELIKIAEQTIPDKDDGGKSTGEQKLIFVRSQLETAYKMATDTTLQFEQLWPALEAQIKALVAAYNAVGVFRRG